MSKKTQALLFNVLAILCWCVSPLAIRYIKDDFPVNVQNFFRYLVSLFVIWPVFFLSHRGGQTQRMFGGLKAVLGKLCIIAALNYVFQISFTYSFFLLYPGFAMLLYKSGVIFSVLLALLMFPDERRTLRNRQFQYGLVLAFIGVVATIAGGEDFGKMEFNVGVLMVLIAAGAWSLLTALIKRWIPSVSPSFAVSAILTLVTPLYLLTYIVMSGGFSVPDASASMWGLMLISGVIGVAVAHSLYYHSVPTLGVALCASLDLSRPFLVGVISFFVFGESLTLLQVVGGCLLLFGSYLVIKARFRTFS